jgi:hypothetical protein
VALQQFPRSIEGFLAMARLCVWLVCLLFLLVVAAVDAQVIAAPDQGDELESRAFADGQGRLDDAQRARAQGDRIDINVYR